MSRWRHLPSFAIVILLHMAILTIHRIDSTDENGFLSQKNLKIQLRQKARSQIVQTQDSKKEPKDIRNFYLSESNNYFDKQTRARKVDTFSQGGAPSAQASKPKQQHKKQLELGKLKLSPEMIEQAIKEHNVKTAKRNGRGPSSASNDYLEDLPLGDINQLNTQEYKFYGYYLRIRERLEQFWGMSLQEKSKLIYRSGRRLASDGEFITNLTVVLNQLGEITEVRLVSSSGYQELDAAAVESFNKAGPFPHPPRELVEKGFAEIDWGFVVKNQ